MLSGKKLTALIPVRGGSKGIPGKNLRKIGTYSLLERAIKLAQSDPRIDHILVSTDDEEMYQIAGDHGVATPTMRPDHLATDEARTIDVVEDLVSTSVIEDGVLLLLQATSPLRTREDLKTILDQYEQERALAIVSLCENGGEPPEKLQKIEDGDVVSFMGTEQGRPRQGMSQTYEVNGAFYVIELETLRAAKSFIPPGTKAYLMPRDRSANLDTREDWEILQAMLETGRWTCEEFD
jgi:CMP-N-acetylneuraminic acid synthetase